MVRAAVLGPAIRAVVAADAEKLRQLRLRALQDSPDAFGSSLEVEQAYPDEEWLDLARRSETADDVAVYVAVDGDRWLGMAAGRWYDRETGVAGLWGMWVDPAAPAGGSESGWSARSTRGPPARAPASCAWARSPAPVTRRASTSA